METRRQDRRTQRINQWNPELLLLDHGSHDVAEAGHYGNRVEATRSAIVTQGPG